MASIADQGLKLNLKSNSDNSDASDSIYSTQNSYTSISFKDKYSIHERIGKGAYATVHRCRRKSDDKDFAVKNIDIRPLKLQNTYDPDRIIREVRVHGTLVHPNIVKLEETYWTRSDGSVPLSPSEYDRLLIVLEYAPGKELFDEILEKKKIEEERARNISKKVLDAIAYIHNVNILHRDIKPENILLTNDGNVKLLDFGLSRSVGSGSYAKTFAGTPEYFAPEVDPKRRAGGATEGYGVKADCYSLGACIYVMLSGIFPEFEARADGTKVPSFERESHWKGISSNAKDLVAKLMDPHPVNRPTSAEALKHPWFTNELNASKATLDAPQTTTIIKSPPRLSQMHVAGDVVEGLSSKKRKSLEQRTPSGVMMEVDIADTREHTLPEQPDQQTAIQLQQLMELHIQVKKIFHEAYTLAEGDFKIAIALNAKSSLMVFQEANNLMQGLKSTSIELGTVVSDLKLAVEEGEPELASQIFNNINAFSTELRTRYTRLVKENKDIMLKIEYTGQAALQKRQLHLTNGGFNTPAQQRHKKSGTAYASVNERTPITNDGVDLNLSTFSSPGVGGSNSPGHRKLNGAMGADGLGSGEGTEIRDDNGNNEALKSMNLCVNKLAEVDVILSKFTDFWGKMENAMTSIIQKNSHVESMLNFTHNQKLRKRFFTRLDEYQRLWREIGAVCSTYVLNEAKINGALGVTNFLTAGSSTMLMNNDASNKIASDLGTIALLE
eukprot:g1016.t1